MCYTCDFPPFSSPDLVIAPVEDNMKICHRVIGHEDVKDEGVGWRIRVRDVADLKAHFECATSISSPILHQVA